MHPPELTAAASPLQLRYAFVTTPNPVRASLAGSNPNTVDVQVLVSNPTGYAVQLASIQITIPMGEDTARALGSAASLPPPSMDVPAGWRGASSGSTVTLSPLAGTTAPVTGTIVFTLPGIAVNTMPGTVPITVTEQAPPAPRATDSTSYSILKQPSDFPIADFWADPRELDDLELPTTLHWRCTPQGSAFVYSVRSDKWQPNDCLGAGECLQCADGAAGVATPRLRETTTFALDVISADAAGHRTVHATLTTRVRVSVPRISPNSRLEQSVASGQLVVLRWIAYDAARVSVAVNGATVDDDAPADCYQNGYPLLVGDAVGPRTVSIVAHALTGPAAATWTFPEFNVTAQAKLPCDDPWRVVMAGSGKGVAAMGVRPYQILLWDASTKADTQLDAPGLVESVVASRDGSLLYATASSAVAVYVVRLADRTISSIPLPNNFFPLQLALTTDGTRLLLATPAPAYGDTPRLLVVDLASGTVQPVMSLNAGDFCVGIAPTPDGRTALVTAVLPGNRSGVVAVVDLASWTTTARIPLPSAPNGSALSPDGTLLLHAYQETGTVSVFDVASRTVEPATIAVGQNPLSVAFSRDGVFALVANHDSNSISVIDVARRRCVPGAISLDHPKSVAPGPDGTTWVASSEADGFVFL